MGKGYEQEIHKTEGRKFYVLLCFYYYDNVEEEMATHPNIFAWRIPRTEEAGGL